MISIFQQYYRCPDLRGSFQVNKPNSLEPGHFQWGEDIICYGRSAAGFHSHKPDADLYDVTPDVVIDQSCAFLPFEPDEVLQNFQRERYSAHFREPGSLLNSAVRQAYYFLRPFMTVPVRKHLQRLKLRDWESISFPEWPVDCSVDKIHRRMMALAMKASGQQTIPFIWFWPENHLSCAILTHDVESAKGRDFCTELINIDESFGFYGSYQVVPETRYAVPSAYLSQIVKRGCEVNVHDLNHDGRLYVEYDEFCRRAKKINQYAKEFNASGFRSGIMYRNADWYDQFNFDYDMSIPNVGHLDPQRGGCCTVMPYFIDDLIELPTTCTQDYTLFHMLNDYTTNIWRQQISLIMASHGLITILVHPDYVIEPEAQASYKRLLQYLAEMRDTSNVWCPLPKEVSQWWRQRNQMQLVQREGNWVIEGEGKERARIAYARLTGDTVTYSFHAAEPAPAHVAASTADYGR